MTKKQKFEASKWLGTYMRTSEYHRKRAAKAAATRKRNRDAKMKALGITTPEVKLPKRKPVKKKAGTKKKATKKKVTKKKATKK